MCVYIYIYIYIYVYLSLSLYIYIYIYIHMYIKRGGRVLLTEILLPRIARQGTICLSSIGG